VVVVATVTGVRQLFLPRMEALVVVVTVSKISMLLGLVIHLIGIGVSMVVHQTLMPLTMHVVAAVVELQKQVLQYL
jgi:hypothetical protein